MRLGGMSAQGAPDMSTQWFCRIMGEEWGPMSALELVTVARRGRLTRNDLVRHGRDGNWVRAEIVDGLFNTAPTAPTATSKRLAVVPRPPAPAKRLLQEIRPLHYWVKYRNTVAGPFTRARLRELAADGKLKPHFMISRDQRRWVLA